MITAAAIINAFGASIIVPGTSDPWLAGMTNGATASGGDVAPNQSPVEVSIPIISGTSLTFVTFGAESNNNNTNRPLFASDGNTNQVLAHAAGAQNGIADCTAPIDSLLGVFLGNDLPSLTAAPAALNFTTQPARDFTNLVPGLKQVFFIGDGFTSTGVPQTFSIPQSATRLFLGFMDGSTWFDNRGSNTVNIQVVGIPQLNIVRASTTNVAVYWTSISNALHQVEFVSDLTASTWSPLGLPIRGDGNTNYVFDSVAESQCRFYRLIIQP
jgi:hypothetical protein